jgi:hypothetical protein
MAYLMPARETDEIISERLSGRTAVGPSPLIPEEKPGDQGGPGVQKRGGLAGPLEAPLGAPTR